MHAMSVLFCQVRAEDVATPYLATLSLHDMPSHTRLLFELYNNTQLTVKSLPTFKALKGQNKDKPQQVFNRLHL
jgi:hypothetical protein